MESSGREILRGTFFDAGTPECSKRALRWDVFAMSVRWNVF